METTLIALLSMAAAAFGFLAYNRPPLARKLVIKSSLVVFVALLIYLAYSKGQEQAFLNSQNIVIDESDKYDYGLDSLSETIFLRDSSLTSREYIRTAIEIKILTIKQTLFSNAVIKMSKRLEESYKEQGNVIWIFIGFGIVGMAILYASHLIEKDRIEQLSKEKETETNQSASTENK